MYNFTSGNFRPSEVPQAAMHCDFAGLHLLHKTFWVRSTRASLTGRYGWMHMQYGVYQDGSCNFRLKRIIWGPSASAWMGLGGRVLRLEQARGPHAEARTDLGTFRLGNCTLRENALGKLPLGKIFLGKYPTPKPWQRRTLKLAIVIIKIQIMKCLIYLLLYIYK